MEMDLQWIDLQGLLVSIIVVIVCALLVWGITSLMVREHPFEERLEQQRHMENVLLQLDSRASAQGPKKDKLKKKNKKAKSTEHDNVPSARLANVEKVEAAETKKQVKMVELEIEPEVIETSPDEPTITTNKKKKPSKVASPPVGATKPILVNWEEKSAIRKTDEITEMVHRRSTPKDAVELKHDRDRRKSDSGESEAAQNGLHAELARAAAVATSGHKEQQESKAALHVHVEQAKHVVVEQQQHDTGKTSSGGAARDKAKKQHREVEQLTNGDNSGEAVITAQVAAQASVSPPLPPSTVEQPSKKKKVPTATLR